MSSCTGPAARHMQPFTRRLGALPRRAALVASTIQQSHSGAHSSLLAAPFKLVWGSVTRLEYLSTVSSCRFRGRVCYVSALNGRIPQKASAGSRHTNTWVRGCSSTAVATPSSTQHQQSNVAATMADREILPSYFKPAHYDLVISDLDFANWTFQGRVRIDGSLEKSTKEVVLNTLELKLKAAKFSQSQTKSDVTVEAKSFEYDEAKQRATISFGSAELSPSNKASLTIEFEGILNHDMAGFYRSQYKPPEHAPAAASVPRDESWHYMLSTQFEACDARRAFPCFDEPKLKATFGLALEIPEDQTALSNMPVKETSTTKAGKKLVSFERTPIMSTYLLAFAVGDFEYIEGFTDRHYNGKRLPVRVYTTRGLKEQGRWALQHAPKFIDFFSESFGLDYPLPKSDILAVHEFTHGAMENWGLVTYRMTAILFDETQSEALARNRIAYVVAHELAHQWFGNLVTMDWWDELWLNEGFATWAGWLATDHVHPDWEVWPQFVNEGMESALKLDSIRASHPIQVPVRDALDVNQVFDAISYLKGCSVIRMLANYLGVQVFLKGVSAYLKKHEYGNAKTEALWAALSEASGKDVNTLMAAWVGKTGFPVLTVAEEPGQITVRQSRFLTTGDVKAEDDEVTWWIPLSLEGKASANNKTETLALTAKEDTIRGIDDEFYKLNIDATGFYRINYPPPRLAKLGTQLNRLNVAEKVSIIGSAADLAFAGNGTTASLLAFLEGFNKETHFRALNMALDAIDTVKSVFSDDAAIKKGIQAFTLRLIEPTLEKLGWDFPVGEDYSSPLLRKRILLSAVANGNEKVIAEANKRFQAYSGGQRDQLHPDLRLPVFRAALKSNAAHAVTVLQQEWATGTAVDTREVILKALGHASDTSLIESTLLPFLFGADATSTIPAGDMHILALGLSTNAQGRPLLWRHMRDHWEDQVLPKIGGNPIVLDRLVNVSLSRFSDGETLKEIDAFFAGKDTKAFDRTLGTVKDKIRGRAAYRQRDAAGLKEWLVAHGYTESK